jgi:hypothetical protein
MHFGRWVYLAFDIGGNQTPKWSPIHEYIPLLEVVGGLAVMCYTYNFAF